MTSFVQINGRVWNKVGRLFCFVVSPFVFYYLYLDWRYTQYMAEYAPKLPPLSKIEYMMSRLPELQVLVYSVLLGTVLMILCVRISRKETVLAYDKHIAHMRETMAGLEHRASFQSQCLQRFKQIASGICKAVSHVGESTVLPSSEARSLLHSSSDLAEHLAIGLCPSDESAPIVMADLLDQVLAQFAGQLSKQNLQPHITCSPDMVLIGDSLFVKQILLNIIGAPLCRMPRQGKMVIQVIQGEDFVHVEIRDNRYVLSQNGVEQLKAAALKSATFPFDILVEERYLRHTCHQNGIGYEALETPEGECLTKVSFPLNPGHLQQSKDEAGNVIVFPSRDVTFH